MIDALTITLAIFGVAVAISIGFIFCCYCVVSFYKFVNFKTKFTDYYTPGVIFSIAGIGFGLTYFFMWSFKYFANHW